MKFIHTADIHLGAKMDSKFPREISELRKGELRSTFKRMVDFAREQGVKAILLSGDVFDSNSPFRKDKDFFYSVVRGNPDVDFLYLKGNHDTEQDYAGEAIGNLKTFSDCWTSYEYGDVVVTGIETTALNAVSMYSTLDLEKDKTNIVMLHGQVGDASGKDKVNLKKLRDKNIDYLALGHIHRPGQGKLDERGSYVYCGCLEGRGFDETGQHGFFLLDTERRIEARFVPFAARQILEEEVDVSGVRDAYSAYRRVKEAVSFEKKNIYRIDLMGETDLELGDIARDVATYLGEDCLFADVKDRTVKKLDLGAYEKDRSLKGEFVRLVSESTEYSDEDKKRIIACGLKALSGGEPEV